MNTDTILKEEGTANPSLEWKDVIRDMHALQAETWKKSAAHWRECARKAWDRENLAAASHALMIATLAESYAAEEQRAAGEFAPAREDARPTTMVPCHGNGFAA